MYDFGFIGCGHMGAELARVTAKTNKFSIALCNRTKEKALELQKEIGGEVLTSAKICSSCKYIVIGVRPQSLTELIAETAEILKNRKERFIIVSMLAGKKIQKIKEEFGIDFPIIRIMPNTPVAIGEGVILVSYNGVTDEEKEAFCDAFSLSGSVIPIDESLMDAGCVVSGCGPAYVYRFISAFAAAGEKIGFDKQTALKLVCETVVGAAKMIISTGKSAETLCGEVCSKGGATEQGVFKLDASDLGDIMEEAAKASYDRTVEMGK